MQMKRDDVHNLCWVRAENVVCHVSVCLLLFWVFVVVVNSFLALVSPLTSKLKILTAVGRCLGLIVFSIFSILLGTIMERDFVCVCV